MAPKSQAAGSQAAARRSGLTPARKAGIAQIMQYALLDEILGANVWRQTDIVFQGGTLIHVAWNSPRFSEDLDFMISMDRAKEIKRVMETAARGLERRIQIMLPNSEVRLKSPSKDVLELRDVLKYVLVWSAPDTMGAVRVKAEFFTVEPSHIEAYRRESARHEPDAMQISLRPELAGYDLADLTVHAVLPAGHPESIYGDKLVALAMRPFLKPRDFFDLWWLGTQLGVRVPDGDLHPVMRRSADCYAYTDGEILQGLNTLMERPPGIVDEIRDNLAAFLPAKVHRQLCSADAFTAMYRHVMAEALRLAAVLEPEPCAAPEPAL